MRPTRASLKCRSIRRRAQTPRQIEAGIREVFDDFPNQLVEIYSVLAERIGETLSGESASFFVSVFGPDLDRDDAVAARDRARCSSSCPTAARCA